MILNHLQCQLAAHHKFLEPLIAEAKIFLKASEIDFIEQCIQKKGYLREDAKEAWFTVMCSLTAPQA